MMTICDTTIGLFICYQKPFCPKKKNKKYILKTFHMYYKWCKCRFNRLNFAEVELVGGSGPHEGNIHVGGLPVCDDGHGAENARVVCRFDQIQN